MRMTQYNNLRSSKESLISFLMAFEGSKPQSPAIQGAQNEIIRADSSPPGDRGEFDSVLELAILEKESQKRG